MLIFKKFYISSFHNSSVFHQITVITYGLEWWWFSVVSDSLLMLMDYSPPGSSVHGILQVRILEWVAIPFSRGFSQPRDRTWSPALQEDSLLSESPGKQTLCLHAERLRCLLIVGRVGFFALGQDNSEMQLTLPGLGLLAKVIALLDFFPLPTPL